MAFKLGETTQALVNAFPSWSSIRIDDQSLGFQFFNVFGQLHDDLAKQVKNIGDNYFLPTANIDDIDVVYQFRLPDSFQFNVDIDADGTEIPTFPTISGEVDGTLIPVRTLGQNNTLENFWYKECPDRLATIATASGNHILLPQIPVSGMSFPSSGVDFTNSGLVHINDDARVWITISGGSNMIDINNGVLIRGIVNLEGISKGVKSSESLIFLFDKTQATIKEWSEITLAGVNSIDPLSATIEIKSARFQDGPYKDFYNLENAKFSKEPKDVFFDVRMHTPTASGSDLAVLQKIEYVADEFNQLIDGFVQTQEVNRTELLTSSGTSIGTVSDMAVQPFTDNIWVLTEAGKLYIYDKSMDIPSISAHTKKNYDANVVFESTLAGETGNLTFGDSVSSDIVWRRPTKRLLRYRVIIDRPDGVKLLSTSAGLIPFTTGGGFIDGDAIKTRLVAIGEDAGALGLRGEWVFTLESKFADETTQFDQRTVLIASKDALAEYDISSIPTETVSSELSGTSETPQAITGTITGIDFDSKHRLWLRSDNGFYYVILPHWDIALVDFGIKLLLFRERYSQVRVVP